MGPLARLADKIVLGDKFHCVKDVVCEHSGNATEQNVSQAFTYLAAQFIIEHNICEKYTTKNLPHGF